MEISDRIKFELDSFRKKEKQILNSESKWFFSFSDAYIKCKETKQVEILENGNSTTKIIEKEFIYRLQELQSFLAQAQNLKNPIADDEKLIKLLESVFRLSSLLERHTSYGNPPLKISELSSEQGEIDNIINDISFIQAENSIPYQNRSSIPNSAYWKLGYNKAKYEPFKKALPENTQNASNDSKLKFPTYFFAGIGMYEQFSAGKQISKEFTKPFYYVSVSQPSLCIKALNHYTNLFNEKIIDLNHILFCQSTSNFKEKLKLLQECPANNSPFFIVHPEALNEEDLTILKQFIKKIQNGDPYKRKCVVISSLPKDVFDITDNSLIKNPPKDFIKEEITIKDKKNNIHSNIEVNLYKSTEPGSISQHLPDLNIPLVFIDKSYQRIENFKNLANQENICFILSPELISSFNPFFDDLYILLKYKFIFYDDFYEVDFSKVKNIYIEIQDDDCFQKKIQDEILNEFPIPCKELAPTQVNTHNEISDILQALSRKTFQSLNSKDNQEQISRKDIIDESIKLFYEETEETKSQLDPKKQDPLLIDRIIECIEDNINFNLSTLQFIFIIRNAFQAFNLVPSSEKSFFYFIKKHIMSDKPSKSEFVCYCGDPSWNDKNQLDGCKPKLYNDTKIDSIIMDPDQFKKDFDNYFHRRNDDNLFKISFDTESQTYKNYIFKIFANQNKYINEYNKNSYIKRIIFTPTIFKRFIRNIITISQNIPLLIQGSSGSGKTLSLTLIKEIISTVHSERWIYKRINCDGGTSASQFDSQLNRVKMDLEKSHDQNKTCIIFTDEVNTSPALTYIIYQMHKHKKSDKITFIGAINPYSTTKVLARHISRIGIVQNIPKTSYKVHLYKPITDVSIHSLFMEDENNLSYNVLPMPKSIQFAIVNSDPEHYLSSENEELMITEEEKLCISSIISSYFSRNETLKEFVQNCPKSSEEISKSISDIIIHIFTQKWKLINERAVLSYRNVDHFLACFEAVVHKLNKIKKPEDPIFYLLSGSEFKIENDSYNLFILFTALVVSLFLNFVLSLSNSVFLDQKILNEPNLQAKIEEYHAQYKAKDQVFRIKLQDATILTLISIDWGVFEPFKKQIIGEYNKESTDFNNKVIQSFHDIVIDYTYNTCYKYFKDPSYFKLPSLIYHILALSLSFSYTKRHPDESMIAVLFIGMPGTSKSLAIDLFSQSKPKLFVSTYLTSASSETECLDAIYRDLATYQEDNTILCTMAFLDELGFGNFNPHRPTKALHYYFDIGVPIEEDKFIHVFSVGASNYSLDYANQNRTLLISTNTPDVYVILDAVRISKLIEIEKDKGFGQKLTEHGNSKAVPKENQPQRHHLFSKEFQEIMKTRKTISSNSNAKLDENLITFIKNILKTLENNKNDIPMRPLFSLLKYFINQTDPNNYFIDAGFILSSFTNLKVDNPEKQAIEFINTVFNKYEKSNQETKETKKELNKYICMKALILDGSIRRSLLIRTKDYQASSFIELFISALSNKEPSMRIVKLFESDFKVNKTMHSYQTSQLVFNEIKKSTDNQTIFVVYGNNPFIDSILDILNQLRPQNSSSLSDFKPLTQVNGYTIRLDMSRMPTINFIFIANEDQLRPESHNALPLALQDRLNCFNLDLMDLYPNNCISKNIPDVYEEFLDNLFPEKKSQRKSRSKANFLNFAREINSLRISNDISKMRPLSNCGKLLDVLTHDIWFTFPKFYRIFTPTNDKNLIIQGLGLEYMKISQQDNLPIIIIQLDMEQFKQYFNESPFTYSGNNHDFILVLNFYDNPINIKKITDTIDTYSSSCPHIIVLYTNIESNQKSENYVDMATELRNYENLEDIINNHTDCNNFVVFTQTFFSENIQFFNNSEIKCKVIPSEYIVSTEYLTEEINEDNDSEFIIILCNEFNPLQFYQLSNILKHTNSVKSIIMYHTDEYSIHESYISLSGWKTFWDDIITNDPLKRLTPKVIYNLLLNGTTENSRETSNEDNKKEKENSTSDEEKIKNTKNSTPIEVIKEKYENSGLLYIKSCFKQGNPLTKKVFENFNTSSNKLLPSYKESKKQYNVASTNGIYKDIIKELFDNIMKQFISKKDDNFNKAIEEFKSKIIDESEKNIKDITSNLINIRHSFKRTTKIFYIDVVKQILFVNSKYWLPSLKVTFQILKNNFNKIKNSEHNDLPYKIYMTINDIYKYKRQIIPYLSLIPNEEAKELFEDIMKPATTKFADYQGTSSITFLQNCSETIITELSNSITTEEITNKVKDSLLTIFQNKRFDVHPSSELKYNNNKNYTNEAYYTTNNQISKSQVFTTGIEMQFLFEYLYFGYDLFNDFPQKFKSIFDICSTPLYSNAEMYPLIIEEFIQENDYAHEEKKENENQDQNENEDNSNKKDKITTICDKYAYPFKNQSIDLTKISIKPEVSYGVEYPIQNYDSKGPIPEKSDLFKTLQELLGIRDNDLNQKHVILKYIPNDLFNDTNEKEACEKLGALHDNFKRIVLSYFTKSFDKEDSLIQKQDGINDSDYSNIFKLIFSNSSINERNMPSLLSKIIYLIVQTLIFGAEPNFMKYFRTLIKVLNPYFSLQDKELSPKYYILPYIFLYLTIQKITKTVQQKQSITLDTFDQIISNVFSETICTYLIGVHCEYLVHKPDNRFELNVFKFPTRETPTFGYLLAYYLSQHFPNDKGIKKKILLLLQQFRLDSNNHPKIFYTYRLMQIKKFISELEKLYTCHLDLLWIILNTLTISELKTLHNDIFSSELFERTSNLFNNQEEYEFLQYLSNDKNAYDALNDYKSELINVHNDMVSLFNINDSKSYYQDLQSDHLINQITFQEVFVSTIAQSLFGNEGQPKDFPVEFRLDDIDQAFSNVFNFFSNINKNDLYTINDDKLLGHNESDFRNSIRTSLENSRKLISVYCPDITSKEAISDQEVQEDKTNQVALLLYVCAFRKNENEVPFVIPTEDCKDAIQITSILDVKTILPNTSEKSHPVFKEIVEWANPYLEEDEQNQVYE